jgi:hypothetical protein
MLWRVVYWMYWFFYKYIFRIQTIEWSKCLKIWIFCYCQILFIRFLGSITWKCFIIKYIFRKHVFSLFFILISLRMIWVITISMFQMLILIILFQKSIFLISLIMISLYNWYIRCVSSMLLCFEIRDCI